MPYPDIPPFRLRCLIAAALAVLGVAALAEPAGAAAAFPDATPAEMAAGGAFPASGKAAGPSRPGSAAQAAIVARPGFTLEPPSLGQPGWNLSTLQQLNTAAAGGALDLAHAWRLTVLHDPNYHAALSARGAAQTERRQGRAALLPQVNAGYSRNRITGDQTQYDAMGQGHIFDLDYDSTNAYIQLQQPIINYGRYADFRRGIARADLGIAEFHAREQGTALTLSQVYLRALRTDTEWRLAEQLADSLEKQAIAQDRLFEANEGDRVDAQETRARLALARSEVIRARDARDVALRELAAMTGGAEGPLAALRPQAPPPVPRPASLDEWRARVSQANPAVQVARETLRVAEAELQRATGRYLPTLDLVVGYAKADSENLSSLSQRTNTWSAGLHASIPLFSGGYDTANRARASAEVEKARQELRAAQEAAEAEAVRQYTAVVGGADRIRALRAAVESSEQSLEAAQASYQYGVRSNVDVLRSQDRLYEARLELADARLSSLEALTALWAATGELNENRFQEVSNTHLE
ncbi:TolC family outer membrane protein [Alcaligenaceae bacterium]|nr:TolC family outer membrane protein [Alcaligenaceae bacterium]